MCRDRLRSLNVRKYPDLNGWGDMYSRQHISIADMERYFMGEMREPDELSILKEHVLQCLACLDRMEAVMSITGGVPRLNSESRSGAKLSNS